MISNYGTQFASVVLNTGSSIGAFTSGDVIPPGGYIVEPTGSSTNDTAISLTGTTSIQISGGAFVNQPLNVAQWAGVTLGSPTAWGTAPVDGLPVQNVNAFIAGGTLTATLGAFAPTPAYQTLSVGASSARVALPSGSTVVVYNTGANNAFVTIGNGSVAATTSNDVVVAGCWMSFSVGAATNLAAIENAGSTSLTLSGGSGLPAGGCAGAGGGSSSNASVGATGATAPTSATYNGMLVSGGNMVGESGSAWGAAPTGLNVFGVNANVLNNVPLGQGGSALSNTNGIFANILQGNAVLSATNGVFVTPSTGASIAVTQATAANLNATVVGPAGAALATSALQTTGNTSAATSGDE